MSWPTYTVEVQWGTDLTGLIIIGSSTIGSTDVIGGMFVDAGYTDETAYVKSFSLSKGRSGDTGQMMAGTATIELWDTAGRFNPGHESSPIYANLKPMQIVRITASWDGTDYVLFFGFIQRIGVRPRKGEHAAYIEATDLFSWLSLARPTISSTSTTTTGAAIGVILDAIEWTNPAFRDLDDGDTIDDFSADGTTPALTLIRDLLTTERGQFFIENDGTARFDSRNARYEEHTSVDHTTSGTMVDLEVTTDASTIFNAVSVTKTGTSAQTANDEDSQRDFGIRDFEAINSTYLQSAAQASSLADYLIWRKKSPTPPATATYRNRSDTIVMMLSVELNDLVNVNENYGNTTGHWHVENVQHTVSAASKIHETQLLMTRRDIAPIIIGVSTIGSTDAVGY